MGDRLHTAGTERHPCVRNRDPRARIRCLGEGRVPGFDQLLHGNKTYLAVTTILGVVALIGGVAMLVAASDIGLDVVMAAMLVLWLLATIHHIVLLPSTAPTDMHTSRHGPALRH